MKYTIETEINAPREGVAELAGNPDNRKKWMEGLHRLTSSFAEVLPAI